MELHPPGATEIWYKVGFIKCIRMKIIVKVS